MENKFKELKSKGEIEAIEKRLESLEDADSSINRIWAEIYRDVLDLKKKEEEHEDKDWSVLYSQSVLSKYCFSQICILLIFDYNYSWFNWSYIFQNVYYSIIILTTILVFSDGIFFITERGSLAVLSSKFFLCS